MRGLRVTLVVLGVHVAVLALLYGLHGFGRRQPPGVAGTDRPAGPPPTGLAAETFTHGTTALPAKLAKQADQQCRTGILIDWSGRQILWAKGARTAVPVASLTKMMTALLLMESVRSGGGVALTDRVKVTVEASRVEESQVYLDPRETFTLDELLKCMLIFSANDCAYLLAQHLGQGSVPAFVDRMNQRAVQLALPSCRFHNPHGLPEPNRRENEGSALEMAYLAAKLLEYPEVVRWSSTYSAKIRENTAKPFQLTSRNRLVKGCPGVVGMKTGFTQKAGFCIAATCRRNGRIVIAVVTGSESKDKRDSLVSALLEWAYGQPVVAVTGRTPTPAKGPS